MKRNENHQNKIKKEQHKLKAQMPPRKQSLKMTWEPQRIKTFKIFPPTKLIQKRSKWHENNWNTTVNVMKEVAIMKRGQEIGRVSALYWSIQYGWLSEQKLLSRALQAALVFALLHTHAQSVNTQSEVSWFSQTHEPGFMALSTTVGWPVTKKPDGIFKISHSVHKRSHHTTTVTLQVTWIKAVYQEQCVCFLT